MHEVHTVAKIDELQVTVQETSPQVICIVELWLSDEIMNNELSIDHCQLVRVDRNRHGGGVLMYVHDSFDVKVLYL